MSNAAETERDRISSMFDRAEDLRDYPGDYFPARIKAKKALAAWREKYPEAAAAEAAEHAALRAADEARREEQHRTSFVGRGLD